MIANEIFCLWHMQMSSFRADIFGKPWIICPLQTLTRFALREILQIAVSSRDKRANGTPRCQQSLLLTWLMDISFCDFFEGWGRRVEKNRFLMFRCFEDSSSPWGEQECHFSFLLGLSVKKKSKPPSHLVQSVKNVVFDRRRIIYWVYAPLIGFGTGRNVLTRQDVFVFHIFPHKRKKGKKYTFWTSFAHSWGCNGHVRRGSITIDRGCP